MKLNNILGAALVCILPILAFSGCGKKEKALPDKAPNTERTNTGEETMTAEKIIEGYIAKGYVNYRMDIEHEAHCIMRTGKEVSSVISKVRTESARFGKYIYEFTSAINEYGEFKLQYDHMDYMEIIGDLVTIYTSDAGQDDWHVTENEELRNADLVLLDPADFKRALVEENVDDETYVVSVPLKDLSEERDFFLYYIDPVQFISNEECYTKALDTLSEDKHYAVYTFAKDDLRLLSIEYDPFEITTTSMYENISTSLTNRKSISVHFCDYGEVKEKEAKLSDTIKSTAQYYDEEEE